MNSRAALHRPWTGIESMDEGIGDRTRLLVVEDEDLARIPLVRLLVVHGYSCDEATNCQEAFDLLAGSSRYAAVLCDIELPGQSGLELVRKLADDHPDVAVIMTTGSDEPAIAQTAFELGADAYLIKPLSLNQLLITLSGALRRRELERARDSTNRTTGREVAKSLALSTVLRTLEGEEASGGDSSAETIELLSRAISSRDEETAQHIERMSRSAAYLAGRVAYTQLTFDEFRLSATLHDVGKIGVPDTVLLKPAALAQDERALMQRHTTIGYQLLHGSESPVLNTAANIALGHHERWDGTGYPQGLSEQEIPLEARIVAIADVFDALTSQRVYKSPFEVETAVAMMREQRGLHFDPLVLDAFLADLEPILELRQQFPDDEKEPRIRVLLVDDHEIFIASLARLLSAHEKIRVIGSAQSVAEGLEAVAGYLPDIVMMDFELPDGDGAKATRMIKALYPDVRVVMLTAHADRQAMRRSVAAGCSAFVHKTDTVEELVEAIVAAHNGEVPPKFAELREILDSLEPTRRGLGQDLRPREIQVLNLMAVGLSSKSIAEELYLSIYTVRNHVQSIFLKLDAHSKLEAVATAIQEGILVRNIGPTA